MVTVKEQLESKFKGGLPTYLKDYFDANKSEVYQSEEEFWTNNKTEIVKKRRATNHPVFKESPRNTERVEEERNLTKEEIKVLVKLCENDMYLFAIRYFPHYLKKSSSKLHKFIYNLLSTELNREREKGFKWAIAAPRGNAKCLKHDTLIQLSDGSLTKVSDLDYGDEIVCLDDNFKLTNDKVAFIFKPEVKEIFDIKLRSGRTISITKDHRLFSINGTTKLSDLSIGDKIATPRKIDCNVKKNSMSEDEAIFLANMIAEGSLSKGTKLKKSDYYSFKCSYTNFDIEVVEDFKQACRNLGFGISISTNKQYYNIQKATTYLRRLDIGGHKSTDKLIPNEVFQQNNEFLKIFISRFIATDGWVTKYNPSFGITLANEKLIDQLFTILLRIGFRPVKQNKPNDKSGAWAVVCHGVDQLITLSEIGILHKQNKLLKVINKFSKNKVNPNLDTIPKDWKNYLKNTTPHFLRKDHNIRVDSNKYDNSRKKVRKVAIIDDNKFLLDLSNSDIYWDEIVEISDGYLDRTYDIQTVKDNNFIANNIFSHNSSLISAIFPLWCICYNKKRFIVLVSDTAGQAEDFLADIKREILHNEKLQRDFQHIKGEGPTWRANEIITNNNVKMLALGSGNQIRGRRFGIYRPDLVIGDDIENSDDNRSKSKRDFLRSEWFEKDVLFVGGEEGSVTDIVIIGTIIGSESLLNALSNPIEYPDWNRKIFKAVYKFSSSPLWDEWARLYKDRFNDNRIQTAKNFFEVNREEMLDGTEVLWPEGDPYYNNMIEMYFRPAAFQTEKQNSGLDPTKILITYDQLHFTNFNDIEVSKVLKSRRRTIFYGALDPSLGKKADSGDYSCVVTIAKDTQTGYLFVTNIEMARRSVEEQINSIIKSHKKYNYRLFGVETNAFQYVVAEDLRKKSGRTIPVRELNNYHDKKLRFEGIIPFLVDGTIVFDSYKYDNDQQYRSAIEQLCLFTGIDDANDDFPDALEMAVRIARAKKFKRMTKQTKG